MFFVHLAIVVVATCAFFYVIGYIATNIFALRLTRVTYIPMGFVVYEALFWLASIIPIFLKTSWGLLNFVVAIVLSLFLLNGMLASWWKNVEKEKNPTALNKKRLFCIVIALIIACIHGTLQIGFWSTDHSLSDNAFYMAIANSIKNSPSVYWVNYADGMVGSIPNSSYYLTTFEPSITFLSQFAMMSPVAYFMTVIPIVSSIAAVCIMYALFRKFVKSDSFAILGIILFFITIYAAPNYKANIDDFHLQEWFTLYFYTGKVLVRYIITPVTLYMLMDFYEQIVQIKNGEKINVWPKILVLNLCSICFYALSPIASLYILTLLFVFYMYTWIRHRISFKKILFYGLGSIMAFVGLIISIIESINSNSPVVQSGVVSGDSSIFSLFGINSEYVSLSTIKDFFIRQVDDTGYWYYRWQNVGFFIVIAVTLVALITYLVKSSLNEKYEVTWRRFTEKNQLLIVFGIQIPVIYYLFCYLPPIVEMVSSKLGEFTFQRLVGNYPIEIICISWLLVTLKQVIEYQMKKNYTDKRARKLLKLAGILFIQILVALFILMPNRPFVYAKMSDQERVSRLKFKDEYYSGKFDYALLADNPEKADNLARQITQTLNDAPMGTTLVGSINQFFGLSHVRVTHDNLNVVKTRFTRYADQKKQDDSFVLKYYFSPWEEKFATYHEEYSTEQIIQMMRSFDVDYLIVVKSYNGDTIGRDTISQFSDIITDVQETEDFYIIHIK